MLIREFAPTYIEYCREVKLVVPATADKYRDCLQNWIVPALGDKQSGKLKRLDINILRSRMFARKLSIARVYSVLMVLNGFLRYIKEVRKQPCLDLGEVEVPSRGRPHVVYLTQPELERLFQTIPVHTFTGARLRAFVELLLA